MKIIKKSESINVITVGNPTISDDYIVSNFSTSNWIKESTDYTLQYNDVIEINLRYKCTSYGSWGIYLGSGDIYLKDRATDRFEYSFGISGYSTFYISHSLGNWYRLKIIQEYKSSGSTVTFSLSSDEGQTWTTTTTTISYSLIPTFDNIILCQNPDSTSEYLRGELDLKECNIKINNNYIWQGVTPEKCYAIKRPNILYQPTLNGTETITNMSGKSAPTIVDNTLTGERNATPSASGYLSEGWDNSGLWKCEFDVWYSGTETGAYLPSNTSTSRDTNLIMLTSGGGLWTYNNTTASTSSNDFPISYNTWYHVIIEKIDATSFKVTAGNTTKTYTNKATFLQNANKICIGVDSWSNNIPPYYAVIKNIKVTNENEIKYYGIGDNIPSQYQKVDYTQSSGTQYIDTGIKANSESLLYLKCTFNISNPIIQSTSQAGWVYGVEKHQSGGGVISGGLACSTYSSSGKMSVNFYGNSHSTIDMVNNTKNTLEINSAEIIVNGISYPFTGTFQGGALDQNIYLFCLCGYGGNTYYFSSSKIYEFQLGYTKNNLVIDLVPVYDTVTQKYGMYDRISQTFKGNLGTGNFAGGND